jgi:hypothetical protein
MTRARDIADLVDANGDIVAGALDNVPAADLVNDTTPQLGGNLDLNSNNITGDGSINIGVSGNSIFTSTGTFAGLQVKSTQFTDMELQDTTNDYSFIMSNRGNETFEILSRDFSGGSNVYSTPFKIDGSSGSVLTPNAPAFRVARNTTYNHTASNAINFNKASGGFHFNRGGHYSTSTNRFTAPVAGVYTFHCIIIWQGISQGADMTDSLRFQVNGSLAGYSERRAFYSLNVTGNGTYFTDFITDTYDLNANDYVTVIGQKTATVHGNQEYSRWEGHLVG